MYFKKPCNGLITSLYDMNRKHPKTGKVQPHWGVDYGNTPGSNDIWAAAAGKVRAIVRNHLTAGNYVVIAHDNGWETAYLHLASITVSNGQRVSQGQKIGVKGGTGKFVTGTHLHFEMAKGRWTGGSKVNVDPVLHIDDPDVRKLQTLLNKVGYNLVVDGLYGLGTAKAVKSFQNKHGLMADGVAGKGTLPVLEKAAAAVKPSKPVVNTPQIEEEIYLDLNQRQKDEMSAIFKKAREAGIFTSSEHEKNVKAGKMTISQATYLNSVLVAAALNDGKRFK